MSLLMVPAVNVTAIATIYALDQCNPMQVYLEANLTAFSEAYSHACLGQRPTENGKPAPTRGDNTQGRGERGEQVWRGELGVLHLLGLPFTWETMRMAFPIPLGRIRPF